MTNEYTERQCPHNRCLNHNPQFGKSTEVKADFKPSRLFKILIYFKYFCCKKKMKVWLVNMVSQCESCGREKLDPHKYSFLCECCGFHTGIRAIDKLESFRSLKVFIAASIISIASIIFTFISAAMGSVLFLLFIIYYFILYIIYYSRGFFR